MHPHGAESDSGGSPLGDGRPNTRGRSKDLVSVHIGKPHCSIQTGHRMVTL
jgi:hypothetical protein